MIWTYAANQPRNLDLWAPAIAGTITFSWNQRDDSIDYDPFKYCSTRPVPGILHANQESRTVALKFYELSFGTEFDPGHHLKFTTPARIYTNFEADLICPMGSYGLDAFFNLWYSTESLASAFNVSNDWGNSKDRPFDFSDISLSDLAGGPCFHEEILLYCSKELSPAARSFEFVGLDQVKSTPGEWELLNDTRTELLQAYERWEQEQRLIGESYEQEGKEHHELHFANFAPPKVKLVALVVDGVRR